MAPDALPGDQATRQCHGGCLAYHSLSLGTQNKPTALWGSQPILQPQTPCVPLSPCAATWPRTKPSDCPFSPSPGQLFAQN